MPRHQRTPRYLIGRDDTDAKVVKMAQGKLTIQKIAEVDDCRVNEWYLRRITRGQLVLLKAILVLSRPGRVWQNPVRRFPNVAGSRDGKTDEASTWWIERCLAAHNVIWRSWGRPIERIGVSDRCRWKIYRG